MGRARFYQQSLTLSAAGLPSREEPIVLNSIPLSPTPVLPSFSLSLCRRPKTEQPRYGSESPSSSELSTLVSGPACHTGSAARDSRRRNSLTGTERI